MNKSRSNRYPSAPSNTSDKDYFTEMYKRSYAADKYAEQNTQPHQIPMRITEADTSRFNTHGSKHMAYTENHFESQIKNRESQNPQKFSEGGFGNNTFRNFDYAINTHLSEMKKYEKKKKKEREKIQSEDNHFLKSIGINPNKNIQVDRRRSKSVSLQHVQKSEIPEWARVFKQ